MKSDKRNSTSQTGPENRVLGDRGRREHELKCWPEFYEAIVRGYKTFEVRKDDRGFEDGDALWLREWVPHSQQYTGREMRRTVSYLFDLGCPMVNAPGYVVLALSPLPDAPATTKDGEART